MGTRGPAPKRSDQRHTHPERSDGVTKAPAAAKVTVPKPDDDWHDVAKRVYSSLSKSGQSRYFEPSDWALAWLIAESMSRDLSPQVVGTTERGEILRDTIPLKGASLAAYLKAMASLGMTEADRRRMQIELERPGDGTVEPLGNVTSIADRRRRSRAS
jgi:hypothetical protein